MNTAIDQKLPGVFIPEPFNYFYKWLNHLASSRAESLTTEARIMLLHSKTRITVGDLRDLLMSSETSTERIVVPDNLGEQLASLYSTANDGLFEDDQIKTFSDRLIELIYLYGDGTISELAPYIIGEAASAESAAATLRCLSQMEGRISYTYRIWLMERALQSTSSWIRDAAALALESLDDSSAIPYLEEARGKEPNAELRQYLSSVSQFLRRKK